MLLASHSASGQQLGLLLVAICLHLTTADMACTARQPLAFQSLTLLLNNK